MMASLLKGFSRSGQLTSMQFSKAGSLTHQRSLPRYSQIYSRSAASNTNNHHHGDNSQSSNHTAWAAVLTGGALLAGFTYFQSTNKGGKFWDKYWAPSLLPVAQCARRSQTEPGSPIKGLPTYTLKDVQANKAGSKILVTYKNGVYDITKFVKQHPGGEKILLAAGGGLEPFWELYSVHKTREVFEMLAELRVGNIFEVAPEVANVKDAYSGDPKRHVVMKVNSQKPFNGEPPPEMLVDNFYTPNDLFFVRNHLPVPAVDLKSYKLEVAGHKGSMSLSLDQLKRKYKSKTIIATVQCAGNRREEMSQVKTVKGLSWTGAAISNATWTGVKLSDILESLGYSEEDQQCLHVQFEGADIDPAKAPYGASIPFCRAADPRADVLLAYEMNGKPLPTDHGFPVRVVVPGAAGARSVKWLTKIIVSEHESTSHWQQNDYKTFSPSVDWSNVDFTKATAILDSPVQSMIAEPRPSAVLDPDDDEVTVKGYAFSGAGHGIIRVEVSADGGKTWTLADLDRGGQSIHKSWGWTLWEADVPLPSGGDKVTLICKAVDSCNNVQPDSIEGIWNLRGLLNNSWHKITLSRSKE